MSLPQSFTLSAMLLLIVGSQKLDVEVPYCDTSFMSDFVTVDKVVQG